MIIQKFGGTSIGTEKNIKTVTDIILSENSKQIIVLSAISGITNQLIEFIDLLKDKQNEKPFEQLEKINQKFVQFINALISRPKYLKEIQSRFTKKHNNLLQIIKKPISKEVEDKILSFGEKTTTEIYQIYLQSKNIKSKLISATDFMRLNQVKEPDYYYITEKLTEIINKNNEIPIFITQGFICKDYEGNIANLGRGGSDKSATIIGAVLKAKIIKIWSDKDGLLNNDPRFVERTYPLEKITYQEAE